MPQNRLKYFPTAVIRRGMAHFHPALPMPGYVPPAREEIEAGVWTESGGPRETPELVAETLRSARHDGTCPAPEAPHALPVRPGERERLPSPARD